MNITRQNYEEYFLLYIDNELNIVQRRAVEAFVAENPDLRAELDMLQGSVLPADNQISFGDKSTLLRTTSAANPVNESNCEEYFILYADDELTNEQKDQVEQFVYRNPQHQATFELLQQVKLMPDTSVVFPEKYALYRREEEHVRVVPMRWWRMAAAAAVLLFVGGASWYLVTKNDSSSSEYAHVNETQPAKPTKTGNDSHQQQLALNDSNRTQQNPQQAATGQPVPSVPADQPASADQLASTAPTTRSNKGQQITRTVPAATGDKGYAVNQPARNQQGTTDNNSSNNNKVVPDSNIPSVTNVPQVGSVAVNDPKEPKESNRMQGSNVAQPADQTSQPTTGKVIGDRDLAMNTLAVNNNPIADEQGAPEGYPEDKKNKMRGFFRKVSRVFDRATNADPDQTKNSIRIASFEIALK